MARLYRVIVPVGDIDAAQAFYGRVLGSEGRRVSPGRHYFDCGRTILACMDPKAEGDGYDPRPNPECIYLAVTDLEATFAACQEAGAEFSGETVPGVGVLGRIETRPWGERCFYVADLFGNPLCFVAEASVFTG